MKRWFVARTHVGAEEKAVAHLVRQGFKVYLPRYRRRRSHARKVTWTAVALFSQYIFVNIDLDADQWRAIHSTIGVSHLITQGDQPAPVPDGVIEEIQAFENNEGLIDFKTRLKRGDRVIVTEGPFLDQIGLMENMSDEHRVIILLNVLGRETQVKLSSSAVQYAA